MFPHSFSKLQQPHRSYGHTANFSGYGHWQQDHNIPMDHFISLNYKNPSSLAEGFKKAKEKIDRLRESDIEDPQQMVIYVEYDNLSKETTMKSLQADFDKRNKYNNSIKVTVIDEKAKRGGKRKRFLVTQTPILES